MRTLARSQTDHVSLADLLSDAETRDTVLDSPRLVEAILSGTSQLRISSHFYFYVLARHVLRLVRRVTHGTFVFVAIDDGRSDRVGSWLANERTAVPQGARAHVPYDAGVAFGFGVGGWYCGSG